MSGKHPSLARGASDLVGGEWVSLESGRGGNGSLIESRNPALPADVVWSGHSSLEHVDAAVAAARWALPEWSRWPRERRFAVLRRFAKLCEARAEQVAGLICDEVGKVLWDAKQEAAALSAKVEITLDGQGPLTRVSDSELSLGGTKTGRTWFRPHGVMAVVGPYNFPAHLPNGHIVPALAMGNTVVLKPSDKAPAVGQLLVELFEEALSAEGAPVGVVNLVQGGADVAKKLVAHEGLDGILFTGSWPVGRAIMEANLDRPGRILALEMGGNNAAVVMPDADLKQAAIEVVRSAFVTTGQRCTCTRRLIVHEAIADKFISAVCKAASNLIVGEPRAAHPVFMGPMISEGARKAVLEFQGEAARSDGEVLVESSAMEVGGGGWYLTPSVIRVGRFVGSEKGMGGKAAKLKSSKAANSEGLTFGAGDDVEVFGPLLWVAVVEGLEEAVAQVNATRYGLAASIFSKDEASVRRFCDEVRAGCINVNTGTAGASSKLPFGGLGLSGNHRPAGAFSLDYCSYPVAGMVEKGDGAALPVGLRFEEGWLR